MKKFKYIKKANDFLFEQYNFNVENIKAFKIVSDSAQAIKTNSVFLGKILSLLPIYEEPDKDICPTMFTTGTYIKYNPDFVMHDLKGDKALVIFVLIHEILHVVFNHIAMIKRLKMKEHLANVAADYSINPLILYYDTNEDRKKGNYNPQKSYLGNNGQILTHKSPEKILYETAYIGLTFPEIYKLIERDPALQHFKPGSDVGGFRSPEDDRNPPPKPQDDSENVKENKEFDYAFKRIQDILNNFNQKVFDLTIDEYEFFKYIFFNTASQILTEYKDKNNIENDNFDVMIFDFQNIEHKPLKAIEIIEYKKKWEKIKKEYKLNDQRMDNFFETIQVPYDTAYDRKNIYLDNANDFSSIVYELEQVMIQYMPVIRRFAKDKILQKLQNIENFIPVMKQDSRELISIGKKLKKSYNIKDYETYAIRIDEILSKYREKDPNNFPGPSNKKPKNKKSSNSSDIKDIIGEKDPKNKDKKNNSITKKDDNAKNTPETQRRKRIEEIINKQIKKGYGSGSALLDEMIIKMFHSKRDWRKQLRRLLDSITYKSSKDTVFPKRRFVHQGLYISKIKDDDPTLKRLYILIDTSASVSKEELAVFSAEITKITTDLKIKEINVLYFSSTVVKIKQYTNPKELELTHFEGRGGTNIINAFNTLKNEIDEKGKPSAIIIFTDGEAPLPDRYFDYGNKTIWMIINNNEFKEPFGDVIHIKASDLVDI